MFHPKNLDNDDVLETVWNIAHDTSDTVNEECKLPKICRRLNTLICSEDFHRNRRLSLRTSATLINGAARLYKNSVFTLLEDIKVLDENIASRNRKRDTESLSYSSAPGSSETANVEQRSCEVGEHNETSSCSKKRMKINPTSTNTTTSSYSTNNSSAGTVTKNIGNSASTETRPESYSNSSSNRRSPQVENSTSTTNIDPEVQTIQTSNGLQEVNGSFEDDGLDKSLPFAYILIHDNYQSRIPSKIILSSINRDMNNLEAFNF